jgi:hypothetical protein
MLACTYPAFDGPVILFQDIIKILHRSMSTLLFQNSAGFELNDGWRISSVLVGVDDPQRGMVLPAQGFGQKALGRRCIVFGREKEVDRRTGGAYGPVQVHPFAFHPHVRLVHPPRRRAYHGVTAKLQHFRLGSVRAIFEIESQRQDPI